MSKYRITDNKTGKSVIVSGDHEPNETEAESIFQSAGLRQTQNPQQYGKEQGALGKITDFLFGRTKEYGKMLGSAGMGLGAEAMMNVNPEIANKLAQKSYDIRQEQGTTGNLEEGTALETAKKGAGITAGAMGETAAYLMPQNALLKSGKGLTRVAGGALQGAEIGSLLGITDPESENMGERIQKGITQGATGALTGGVVQGLFEVGKAGIKAIAGNAPDKIKKIIRPNPSKLDGFRKNTGMDYADEVIKRDAKNIEGMGYDKLEPYFNNKFIKAAQKTDKLLDTSGKTVKKEWVQQQLLDVMNKYKDRPVVSEQVGKTFTTYFDALEKLGDDIPLSVANNIKRDLQELAKASYSGTSGSVPKAYSQVAYRLNKEIKRLVPKAINLDKETQLYRLVSDAVRRTGSREQNKISKTFLDKLLQTIPASAGMGVGFMTGSPIAGLGTTLVGASMSKGREYMRSPQVQTTLASKISQGINPRMQALLRMLEGSSRKGASIFATK